MCLSLNTTQRNYCAGQLEAWALVAAWREWHTYLRATGVVELITDHCPFKWLVVKRTLAGPFRPYSVTLDHNTSNIYVADNCNNCVKVFDNTAKYLLKFVDGKGEVKMSDPVGLLIRGNKVFGSHNDCILVYQLDGKFVSSIGSGGSGELQFIYPSGLSTDEYNNDIYICDRNNHRIQIISENLQF